MAVRGSLATRFVAKVGNPTPEGCWPWLGGLDPEGYGRIYTGKKSAGGHGRAEGAHRVSYELNGRTIPEGMQIDHLCRNRWCVNPDHLEAVTSRENTLRGEHPNILQRNTGFCKNGHSVAEYSKPYGTQGRTHCLKCNAERAAENRRRRNVSA